MIDVMKILVVLLFVGNLGFLGLNAWNTMERQSIEEYEEETESRLVGIKKSMERFSADVGRVRDLNIIKVEHENTYFEDQAQRPDVGLDPLRDIAIDNRSQTSTLSGNIAEERWKIQFKSKRSIRWAQVAKYCELIENESPQFQIKEVALGDRVRAWGADSWSPRFITVRRLFRKGSRGRN